MTVRELIQELLNYSMDADVECSIFNEDAETTTRSYRRCEVQIFNDYYSDNIVRIHFEDGTEESER